MHTYSNPISYSTVHLPTSLESGLPTRIPTSHRVLSFEEGRELYMGSSYVPNQVPDYWEELTMYSSTDNTLTTLASTQAGEYMAEKTTELTSDLNPNHLSKPVFNDNPQPAK